jgi:pimeloyl-ACP methyl ester carboxylesterase
MEGSPAIPLVRSPSEPVCQRLATDPAGAALRIVCLQEPIGYREPKPADTIVVGFVGGFVNPTDANHPEVLFAAYLREHYSSAIHAEVFANHDAKKTMGYVFHTLDTNHDGLLSDEEKRSARIILYGHSWGASEAVEFARMLERRGIPVSLTIQLDTIPKPGQNPSLIPPNVEAAVNFFQRDGALRGRPTIVASDPVRTTIVGNFRMRYHDAPVDCDNYPWFARTFNRPHHEIENDARLWAVMASMIDERIVGSQGSSKLATRIADVEWEEQRLSAKADLR